MPADGFKRRIDREEGTAAVELIAVLPFLLLALAVAVQIALAGQALWAAGVAARAGARAAVVGGDPESAALRALPESMRGDTRVEGSGPVSVRVRVPLVLPLPDLDVRARSGLEGDDG